MKTNLLSLAASIIVLAFLILIYILQARSEKKEMERNKKRLSDERKRKHS